MIIRSLLVVLALVATAAADPPDPIADRVFPPDLIMSHQRELGLDAAARDKLVGEIQRFQQQAVKIQWDLNAAGTELAQQLAATRVDETAALAAADKVMQLEHDLKHAHLQLLIRLKNALTPAQQAKLRELASPPAAPRSTAPR